MQNFMGNQDNEVKSFNSDFSTNENIDKLKKLVYFHSKTVVFQNSVYWVHLLGDLIYGFLASLDIP